MALSDAMIKLLRQRMNQWNGKHPVDLIWRHHFKIPFGSVEHRAVSVFDQQMWYEEYKLIKEYADKSKPINEGLKKNGVIDSSDPAIFKHLPPDTMSELPMSQEEIETAFDEMDLEELTKKEQEREEREIKE